MWNVRVPSDSPDKRLVISARVTPTQKEFLVDMGDGNISLGLDRALQTLSGMVRACSPPPD
jgi:precorrin-6B methylase 2